MDIKQHNIHKIFLCRNFLWANNIYGQSVLALLRQISKFSFQCICVDTKNRNNLSSRHIPKIAKTISGFTVQADTQWTKLNNRVGLKITNWTTVNDKLTDYQQCHQVGWQCNKRCRWSTPHANVSSVKDVLLHRILSKHTSLLRPPANIAVQF